MRDHPRVCGEKCGPLRWGPEMPGSPPRMRGKASRGGLILKDDGITPAYAGKSIQTFQFVQYHRDHPRVCGEKSVWHFQLRPVVGSPPRMRGKDDRPCAYDHTDRITPAYAGKSGWFQRRLQHGGGSPPRMRGKDLVKFCLCPRFGITPAYAGKSPRTPLAASHARDHPRVCGEKYTCAAVRAGSLGSPPRMRGKG